MKGVLVVAVAALLNIEFVGVCVRARQDVMIFSAHELHATCCSHRRHGARCWL